MSAVKRSREFATHNRLLIELVAGKFVRRIKPERVRVMARAEGYAMVRLKGCMPFVVPESSLSAGTD